MMFRLCSIYHFEESDRGKRALLEFKDLLNNIETAPDIDFKNIDDHTIKVFCHPNQFGIIDNVFANICARCYAWM